MVYNTNPIGKMINKYLITALFLTALISAQWTHADVIDPSKIIGLWHFDGNFDDSSGQGNAYKVNQRSGDSPLFSDNIYQVGTQATHTGVVNDVGLLRLELTEAVAGSLNTASGFGLSMWVYRIVESTGNARFFAFTTAPTDGVTFTLRRASSAPTNQYYLQGSTVLQGLGNPTFTFEYQEWTHFAIASDGETVGFYVNGSLIASAAVPEGGEDFGNYMQIGNLYNGSGSQLNTYWDEVVLYKGPVGSEWVTAIYELGLSGTNIPEPGTYAMLMGITFFAMAIWLRLNSKK